MVPAWTRFLGLLACCRLIGACGATADEPATEGTAGAPMSTGEGGGTSAPGGGGGAAVSTGQAGSAGAGGSLAHDGGKGGSDGTAMATNADGGAGSREPGMDGAAPHVVKPCPVGGTNAGRWEDVSPPMAKLDPNNWYTAAVVAFDMSPRDTATIYLGSNSEGIFKTTDCGANWVKINTGKNGDALGTGRTWSLVVDFTDPNIVYANSGYGAAGLFKSSNGGVDWGQLFPSGSEFATVVQGNFVENVAMDPTDHLHLLVSTHSNCSGAFGPGICFAESPDGGSTWKMIKAPAGLGYENGHLTVLDRQTWFWFQPFGGIWRTTDSGATMPNVYGGYALNSEGRVHRNLDGTYYAASYGGVLKSTDAIAWTLLPGSPRSISVSGNGTKLIASGDPDNAARYLSSVDGGRTWTNIEGPQIEKGWMMRYDPDHDILYSSNHAAGFWRMIKP